MAIIPAHMSKMLKVSIYWTWNIKLKQNKWYISTFTSRRFCQIILVHSPIEVVPQDRKMEKPSKRIKSISPLSYIEPVGDNGKEYKFSSSSARKNSYSIPRELHSHVHNITSNYPWDEDLVRSYLQPVTKISPPPKMTFEDFTTASYKFQETFPMQTARAAVLAKVKDGLNNWLKCLVYGSFIWLFLTLFQLFFL